MKNKVLSYIKAFGPWAFTTKFDINNGKRVVYEPPRNPFRRRKKGRK